MAHGSSTVEPRSTSPTTPSSGRCPSRRRDGSAASASPEQLGVLFGDGAWPTFQCDDRRAASGARSMHDRLAALGRPVRGLGRLGVPAVVRRARRASSDRRRDHAGAARLLRTRPRGARAVREAVGVHGHDADVEVPRRRDRTPLRVAQPAAAPATSTVDLGTVVYTQWCDDRGGILADLTVTRLADRPVPRRRSRRHPPTGASGCCADGLRARRGARSVTDVTAGTTLLSVQGPRSRELLQSLLSPDDLVRRGLPLPDRARARGRLRRGCSSLRVTYLGELGYELHIPTDQGVSVWESLRRGRDRPRPAAGRSARRWARLRLEKGYRDYGVDIENTDDPVVAGLGFTVAWDKPGGFIGKEALEKRRDDKTSAAGQPCCSTTRSRCCTAASRSCATGVDGLRPGGRVRPHPRRLGRPGDASTTTTGSPASGWRAGRLRGGRRRYAGARRPCSCAPSTTPTGCASAPDPLPRDHAQMRQARERGYSPRAHLCMITRGRGNRREG